MAEDISKQYKNIGRQYLNEREKQIRANAEAGFERPSILFINSHLREREGFALLDVGCGGGEDVARYKSYGFASVHGVDSEEGMVAAAQKLLGDVNTVTLGTWTNIPFSDESQDYVVGRSSLHYVDDLDAAYREVARVLKRSGKLIVVAIHPDRAKTRNIVVENRREYVKDSIFGGRVPIKYPLHKLDQYFSPTFLSLFELEDRQDLRAVSEQGLNMDQLAFVARKR